MYDDNIVEIIMTIRPDSCICNEGGFAFLRHC
jgi:hypothetical protein